MRRDAEEGLARLDDRGALLGVDRRKVDEEYSNAGRARVTTYVKRVEANASVSADAGRGLSDLDARLAAAKAETLAPQATAVEAQRPPEARAAARRRVGGPPERPARGRPRTALVGTGAGAGTWAGGRGPRGGGWKPWPSRWGHSTATAAPPCNQT